MIDLRHRGLVRSIGVSNFTQEFLERLVQETGVVPAVNQVELHPYFPNQALRAYHDTIGTRTQSWSPLGKNSPLLSEPLLVDLAHAHNVSVAQVVLRWHVQLGSIPIPMSGDPQHQLTNIDVFSFSLSDDEIAMIDSLSEHGFRIGGEDPNSHEEM
jgi:diketogulonate reductase-like aldo/keto reductase